MSTNTVNIKVIIGSVRAGRYADKPANWMANKLREQVGVEVEVIDLKEYDMPFFNEAVSPSFKSAPFDNPVVASFTRKIAEADGFILVTPEYNHAPSAVLKNALDWVGPEWANKAVAFVGYGSTAGARAVDQLRPVASELQMADVQKAVHIPPQEVFPVVMGQQNFAEYTGALEEQSGLLITQLLLWARALKTVRSENS